MSRVLMALCIILIKTLYSDTPWQLMANLLISPRYYIPTARELQRIESITRSPIYAKFGEALLGVSTIRAYRKQDHFTGISYAFME